MPCLPAVLPCCGGQPGGPPRPASFNFNLYILPVPSLPARLCSPPLAGSFSSLVFACTIALTLACLRLSLSFCLLPLLEHRRQCCRKLPRLPPHCSTPFLQCSVFPSDLRTPTCATARPLATAPHSCTQALRDGRRAAGSAGGCGGASGCPCLCGEMSLHAGRAAACCGRVESHAGAAWPHSQVTPAGNCSAPRTEYVLSEDECRCVGGGKAARVAPVQRRRAGTRDVAGACCHQRHEHCRASKSPPAPGLLSLQITPAPRTCCRQCPCLCTP